MLLGESRPETRAPRTAALAACLFVAATVTLPSMAAAQETRAEEIEKKQADKAATAKPYVPNKFEAIMNRLEENFASPPSGFFPAFGSVYPGGGLTLGGGYRHFYARQAVFDITGFYSLKNYKKIEIGTRTPWHMRGPWTVGLRAGWLDAPQIGFYGIGMGTTTDDRANYRLKQGYGGVNVGVRPTGWLTKTSRARRAAAARHRSKPSTTRRPRRDSSSPALRDSSRIPPSFTAREPRRSTGVRPRVTRGGVVITA